MNFGPAQENDLVTRDIKCHVISDHMISDSDHVTSMGSETGAARGLFELAAARALFVDNPRIWVLCLTPRHSGILGV